jgi:hypothetical protein
MSTRKLIARTGYHQEDMVELAYYLIAQHASILNYLSTLGDVASGLIASLSKRADSASYVTGALSISALASFPASFTTLTGVSITLLK